MEDKLMNNKTTIALLVANRGFFPSSVIESAYAEMKNAFNKAGVNCLTFEEGKTKYNAVETLEDGLAYHDFLEAHRGEYDGLVICLPNFGDENGIKAAIRGIDVPVLIQAYPDELDKMDFEHRRDAFCGKFALESVLIQMGVKFTDYTPFTVAPDTAEFVSQLGKFAATCRVVKVLDGMRVGVIGARTSAFKSVRYDETVLERHGVEVETFDLTAILAVYNMLSDDDVAVLAWKEELHSVANFSCAPTGKDEVLAKFGAALESVIKNSKLDAIAIRCWAELQDILGITPCAVLGLLNHRGIACACETDVSNAVAMKALAAASGYSSGCLDLNNNYGEEGNKCILFHCGPLPSELMDVPGEIQDHKMLSKGKAEKCSWGLNVGKIKTGEITVCGMRATNGSLAFFSDRAVITDDPVSKEFFGIYGVMETSDLQSKLKKIANAGFHHHAIITKTDVVDAVNEALTKYLDYTYVDIH